MLVNLLSNAAKFTPLGGSIQIEGRLLTPSEQEATGNANISNGCNVADNSSCSELVVDIDGSNGLLARLGRRRASTTGSHNIINNIGRDMQTHKIPSTATGILNDGVAGVSFPGEGNAITRVMVLTVKDSGPGIPPSDVARYNKICAVDVTTLTAFLWPYDILRFS